MKKRIAYIDFARGLAIILVVIGHYIQVFYVDAFKNNPILIIIYSFHMPLFFIISGLTFKTIDRNNIVDWIKKKVKQLIIPSYIFILLMMLCQSIMILCGITLFPFMTLDLRNITRALLQIRVDSACNVWFLPTLFFAELILVIIHIITKKTVFRFLLSLIISCIGAAYICFVRKPLPFSIDNSMFAVIFIELGFIYKNKTNINFSRLKEVLVGIGLIVVWIIGMHTNYLIQHKAISLSYVDINNPIIFIISSSAISFVILHICQKVKIKDNNRIILYGKNSLYVYGLNYIFIYYFYLLLKKTTCINIWYSIIVCIITSLIILEASSFIGTKIKTIYRQRA